MLWAGIQRFGTTIISFLSNIVLARLLTPEDFGCIGMLMVFIAISNVFVDSGFGSALIQKTRPTNIDYSTVFFWSLCISIVLYLSLYLCAPLIARFYKMGILSSVLRVQGIILIINAYCIVQFNILRKQMQFRKIAIINIMSATISVVCAIIYAYYGWGIWALVFQQLILGASNIILLIFFQPWRPLFVISSTSFQRLFKFGSYIFLSSIINTFANNFSSIFIGRFFSASSLGYLSQAQKVENIASNSIASTVEQVSYPLLVEVKNDYNKMAKVLKVFNLALLTVVLPSMLALIIIAKPVVTLLFGENWLPSVPMLQLLCIAGIFQCLQASGYNVIAAIGKSATLFRWTIIKRISGISLIILGYLLFGLYGVLYGMICGSIIIWACNTWLVSKYIGYKFFHQISDLLPVFIPAILFFIVCYMLSYYSLLGRNDVIYCILFVLSYFTTIIVIPHPDVREVRINILSMLHKK